MGRGKKKGGCINIISFKVLQKTNVCKIEIFSLYEGPHLRKKQALHCRVSGQLSQHCACFGARHCQMCQGKSFIASKCCSNVEFWEWILFICVCSTIMLKQLEALEQMRHVFLATFGHFLKTFLLEKDSVGKMESDWHAAEMLCLR